VRKRQVERLDLLADELVRPVSTFWYSGSVSKSHAISGSSQLNVTTTLSRAGVEAVFSASTTSSKGSCG
jgi:hypothetical protein